MALWRTTQFRQGMVSFFPKLACCLHNSVHFFLQVSFFPMHLIFSPFSYFASLLHFLQLPSLLLLPILPPPFLFCPLLFFNGQHFTFFFSSFYCPEHPLLISSLSMSLPEHTSTLSFSPQGHFLTFPLSFVTSLVFLSTVSRLKEIPETKPSPMPNVNWHNLQASIKTGWQVIGFIGQRK